MSKCELREHCFFLWPLPLSKIRMPGNSFASSDASPLSTLGFEVHQSDISLEELVEAAEADRAARNENAEGHADSESEDDYSLTNADFDLETLPPTCAGSSCLSSPDDTIPPTSTSPASVAAATSARGASASTSVLSQRTQAQERKADYHKNRRRAKRQKNASNPYTRTNKSLPSNILTTIDVHRVEFDAAHLWLGVPDKGPPKPKRSKDPARWGKVRLRKVEELVQDLKFMRIHWDGRRPLLILDRYGRIIVVFVPGPDDQDWPSVTADAAKALDDARHAGIRTNAFTDEAGIHRRGRFFVLRSGVSHGGGQACPKNASISPACQPLVDNLLGNKSVRRICGFQSSAFKTWAPKLFKDYVTDLRDLFNHDPKLRSNFTNSIFPSVTFNVGPQSASFEHLDDKNRGLGWCAITSAGNFDATKSALLYLKELRLVVDFPSSATSFIPSAVVHHGNTPLASHETRYSITQYAAGGLFRYVQYKFRTAKKVVAAGGDRLKRSFDGPPGKRLDIGLSLFSKPEELESDHRMCFASW
ncbi:hypothetical protein R3P38DRAFT_3317727 [Favolaschia claudopus]|uniref:Uncharacterized protein n=1 Tax=Favolaschia claudopus TaxID=2862362 RepID=A0AAW0BA65_9AGAR